MVAVPGPTAVTRPFASTVATRVFDELQSAGVSSCVLPSSKVPTALNCEVVPTATDSPELDPEGPVIAIESRCAATTVMSDVSLRPPKLAVTVVAPAPTVVQSPLLSMVATDVEEELHVTPLERSELLPSLYVAVATNCWLTPIARVNPTGVTEMETTVGALTVSVVDCETDPRLAEIVVEPAATAEAIPDPSMVAAAFEDELQVTVFVKSALLPSL